MCKLGIILKSANLVEALIPQFRSIKTNAVISRAPSGIVSGPILNTTITITAIKINSDCIT